MKKEAKAELKNIVFITIGSILLAFGVSAFLLPAKIATGGTPGISIIIHYVTDIPVAMAMMMVNIPLIIAGIKFVTPAFAARTIYSVSIISLFISLLPRLFTLPPFSSILLSAIYGGICIGLGIGLVLKGQASAGGTTVIAKIVSCYTSIKPAQALLVLDVTIISAIAIIYKDMELALWSFLSIYVSVKTIDKILSGSASEKVVHIVSKKPQAIGAKISEELSRSSTILTGQNFTMSESREILFVVVGSREIQKLKAIVNKHDSEALVIVMEASEMMGTSLIN